MATSLKTPRTLITTLITSLSPPTTTSATQLQNQNQNPLKDAPPHIHHALLTLHVLFPNEFLPALDLLDRNLITRLTVANQTQTHESSSSSSKGPAYQFPSAATRSSVRAPEVDNSATLPPEDEEANQAPAAGSLGISHRSEHDIPVYRCRNARADASGRSGGGKSAIHDAQVGGYEVRLDAWSCSCPAFAFAAFPASEVELGEEDLGEAVQQWNSAGSEEERWQFGGLTLGGETRVCKHLLACALVEHCGMFWHMVEHQQVSMEEFAGWAAGWGE